MRVDEVRMDVMQGDAMADLPGNAALLIIDVQQGFDEPGWGRRNNPEAELNIAKLLAGWRQTGRPVYHVRHMSDEPDSPLRPGQRGNEFKTMVQPLPHEPIIHKQVNSAFIGTDLDAQLKTNGLDTLVIVGLITDHCVSTTARMAGNMGYLTYVVSDATATFDRMGPDGSFYLAQDIHMISLTSLHREFATIVDTERLLKALEIK